MNREEAVAKVEKLKLDIYAKFEKIGELSDKFDIGAVVYGPDEETKFTHQPWQASSGCEWEQSRQDPAWTASGEW